uniref:Phospholipase C/D domain-containing protein n=2 Tax=Clytia hemisphaerica TaxID=252671 RepID=A0A7M5TRF9_9CNID|eukprot:TCONS_00005424-protein
MKVMLAIAFLLSLMKTIHTCGTSTHISIAHEAATFYQGPLDAKVDYASLIQKHQDAFVAGNPYPDAMYPSVCFGGKYHEVAEDTHWAPFLNATVNYIRRKYPQPWDEATEKLVAFTFGYISHQVADISWHSLAGFKQGFIQAMANVNFHGVFDKAHTDADIGGDMLTQFDNSDDPIGSNTWYVPVDDLYEIYKEFYGGNQTIPKTVIELCSELLYIEYIAEKFAGAKIFKPFVKKSPFLLNQLDNYFLGGIHDMAAWTSKIWNETVFMLEHGTSACNMERSTMHVNCTGYLPAHNGQSVMARKNPGRGYPHKNGGWSYNDVHKTKSLRGVYFTPGDKMAEYITGATEKRKKVLGQTETSEHSYSQIGKSMEEIKTPDDTYYLVISAPTYSDLGRPSIGKVWFI